MFVNDAPAAEVGLAGLIGAADELQYFVALCVPLAAVVAGRSRVGPFLALPS